MKSRVGLLGLKDTRDKSHSVPLPPPSPSDSGLTLNRSNTGSSPPFPQPLISATLSHFGYVFSCPLDLLLASWSTWPSLFFSLLTLPHFLFSHGPVYSAGHVQSGFFQMPLAEISLISTIKPFSSTIPSSDHILIFNSWFLHKISKDSQIS